MAKHFDVTITDDQPRPSSGNRTRSTDEARLDGIYVIRTPVPEAELGAAGTVTAYKNLKYVERDFRHIKSDDLDLRPVFHRLEKRVRGHVLICMLAAYLTWHLRQAWAPLTYTDEDPPAPANPVAPAERSASAEAKARRQHDEHGRPYLSYQGLLDHLGTLTRNELRFAGHARRRPRPHRPHQPPERSLRPHRSRHPAHPEEVARNRRQARRESAGQRRSRHLQDP